MRQYKLGIIGAGAIVESSHLPVLKNLSELSVEWVYDKSISRSQLLSRMYGVSIIEQDWQKAIEDVDMLLISVPYGVRKEYYDAASKAGKSVYVEKPFAVSLAEHKQIASGFASNKLVVGFQRRKYSITQRLTDIIRSGIFGSLQSVTLRQGYFALKGGKGYLSNALLSGGGVIIESAIHSFDQILQCTGATDVAVESMKCLQHKGIDYDSTVHSVLTINGRSVPVLAEITTLKNLSNGLWLKFEHATIHCMLSPDAVITVHPADGKGSFILEAKDPVGAQTVGAAFYEFWSDSLLAVESGKENITTAASSLLTTSWMEKIYAHVNRG